MLSFYVFAERITVGSGPRTGWNTGMAGERRRYGSWPVARRRAPARFTVRRGHPILPRTVPRAEPREGSAGSRFTDAGAPTAHMPMLRQRQMQVKPPHGERPGEPGAAFGRGQNHHSRKKRKEAKKGEEMVARSSFFSSSFVSFGSTLLLSSGLSCQENKVLRLCSAKSFGDVSRRVITVVRSFLGGSGSTLSISRRRGRGGLPPGGCGRPGCRPCARAASGRDRCR